MMHVVDSEFKNGPIEQSQADFCFWAVITFIPINVAFELNQRQSLIQGSIFVEHCKLTCIVFVYFLPIIMCLKWFPGTVMLRLSSLHRRGH